MLKDYTHMTFLLDCSGSMFPNWEKTINGIRGLVEEQKTVKGTITFSLYVFNGLTTKLAHFTDDISNALRLVQPAGSTALYDAFEISTREVGNHLKSLPESLRPEKVIFCVVTDGEENASVRTKLYKVKDILAHQEKVYSWEFTFLGANFDAKGLATSLDIDSVKSWNYTKGNEERTFEGYSQSLTSYRCGSNIKAAMLANEGKVS